MSQQPRPTDTPHEAIEPQPVESGVATTESARRVNRKKVAIGVGIAVVVWIIAMIVKGSRESEADAGRDALGRQKPGIKVVELDDPATPKSTDSGDEASAKTRGELLNELDQLDATVWAKEIEAQRYEAAIIKLWDEIRAADDKLAVLEAAAPPTVLLGTLGAREDIGLGVSHFAITPPGKPRTADAFRALLASFRADGYVVEQTEWQFAEFTPAAAGSPPQSVVDVVIDAHGAGEGRRVTIRGPLTIVWSDETDDDGHPRPVSVDASQLTITARNAPPAFVEVLEFATESPEVLRRQGRYRKIWPILLDDLDGDGLPELILGGRNLVYPNLGGGKFGEPRQFCPQLPAIASAAVLADFSGDGRDDFLCIDAAGTIRVYRGDGRGEFAESVSMGTFPLRLPTAATAGDVDDDGDLDLFVGQNKLAFQGGQMATPYYDANDGEPAYLLRNDGDRFTDVTESSGLAAKRRRHAYGASLVDLTDDGKLDLLVCSDFAGVDFYRGDGAGRFEDVTAAMLGGRHGLSAAHALADFDADGRLDFFVANESSHIVRRLDQLGVGRTDMPQATKMRTAMGYGNRMYMARDGRFEPPVLAEQIARTGAPRGCVAFDVENDGDVDLFVSTGQRSGDSAADIRSEFWRHVIYLEASEPSVAMKLVFDELLLDPLRELKASQNGFQHNVLLANRGERGFLDVAYVLGVASQVDAPTTLAGDIDNDGRVDLVLLEFTFEKESSRETRPERRWPRERLRVLRNALDGGGRWIGVRLFNSPGGRSPIGATVTLTAGNKRQTAVVATGESHGVQRGPVVHFGLGPATAVDKLDIRWPDGKVDTLDQPGVDRYHNVGQQATGSTAAAP
jgi:hypothetical protein